MFRLGADFYKYILGDFNFVLTFNITGNLNIFGLGLCVW